MISRRRQSGYLLITVVVTLFLLATVAVLLTQDSAISANTASSELEATQAEYVARAGMQHALWRAANNACVGDLDVPVTALGADSYDAQVIGASAGASLNVPADQDAWIRNDDPTKNNGESNTNHIRQETGNVEQVLTRFDVSGISAKAQINSAIAWFHLKADKDHSQGSVTVHEIQADWEEKSVTWESFGAAYKTAPFATIPPQTVGDVWVAINVTGLVQAWVNGQPNYGLLMQTAMEGIHTEYTAREDATNPPRLHVVVGSGEAAAVTIKASGTLENGVKRNLKDKAATAYQPPAWTALQPDASGTEDSWITAGQTAWSYGAHGNLRAQPGNQRTLLRMDLQGRVPVGARVTEARLELYVDQVNTADTIDLHRVSRSWEEGTCYGNCAPDDGATWDTYDGANGWETAGGDIDPAAAASAVPLNAGEWAGWDITDLVAAWVTDPSSNFGVMLKGNPGSAVFLSSDDADPALRPRLSIRYACECSSACIVPRGSGNILLVVRDASNMWYYDRQKKAIFESWGYTVSIIDDDAPQSEYDTGIAANDIAYISEPIRESSLGTKLSNAPIGVVSDEGRMHGEFGMADLYATPVLGREISITDSPHYITSVFPIGPLEIYSADMEALTVSGNVSPDLQALAEWGNTTGLAALEAGAQTVSGGTSPGRRVMLPFGRQEVSNVDWDRLNSNGRLIAQRAIDWAMGVDKSTSGPTVLFVVGDAGSLTIDENDKKTLFDSWGYTVTMISDNDSNANYDTALAASDVVYVSGDVSTSGLNSKVYATSLGIVNEQIALHDELGFSSSSGSNAFDKIFVEDNTHSITIGFATGWLTVASSSEDLNALEGTLAPGLQTLATTWISGANYKDGLALLDTGATLYDGGTAPGRRAQIPWGSGTFDFNALNDNGKTIMQRALEWAVPGSIDTGPIAHWKLDESSGTTAVDSEGGHDGVASNTAWVSGQIDGGLEFNSASDSVVVPHSDNLSFTDQLTIAAWIYKTGMFGYDAAVVKATSGSDLNYFLGSWENNPVFGFSTSTDNWQGFYAAGTSLQSGTWYHLAATFDNAADTVNVYVDGALAESFSTTLEPVTNTGNVLLGRSAIGEYWPGILDDVQIYDRALSAGEIAQLAAPPPTTPLAHWKLDETSGTIAADSVGGHDGTLTNGPVWVAGQIGGALDFDGSNDLVSVPHEAIFTQVPMTVSAWFKLNTLPSTRSEHGTIIDKRHTADPWASWTLYVNETLGNKIRFQIRDSSETGYWLDSAASAVTNTWYHVAGTIDESHDAKLYVNGALEPDADNIGSLFDSNDEIRIGAGWSGGNRLDGVVDDVRYYDRALSAAEISGLYTAGTGGGGSGGGGGGSGLTFDGFADAGRSTNGTTLSVAQPSGVEAGDLLIAAIAVDGNVSSSLTPPAGWTPVNVGNSANGRITLGVWWKIATSSEPTQYPFDWSGNQEAYGWISRFTGHDPTSPIIYDSGALTNDSTSAPICQRLTTTEDGVMIMRLGGFDDDDVTIGDPGLAGHTPINMGESGTGSGTSSGGSGYFIQGTAGDSDLAWFQLTNNEEMRTVTLGIRPAPSP